MSDIVLEDQGEPSGLSSNQTAIFPDTTTGKLRAKKGTNASIPIEGVEDHSQLNLDDGTNPHNTTKSDVGLGNVDNTSDLNKPISTATQSALDDKYDASNPNNYETPAELNSRDTANRNRANHTGTQLANTISNFATAVKNVVLSGLTLVNSAVTNSDTVQEAIGKLQGQINNLSFTRIIFSDYIVGTTSDPTTTAQTSGTATTIAQMTKTFTPADASNKIDVFFSGTFGENGSGKDETVFIAVFIDGVEQAETRRAQTTKGDGEVDKISSIYTQWQGSLSASSHTIDIRFWIRGAGGATAVTLNTQRNLIIKEIDE